MGPRAGHPGSRCSGRCVSGSRRLPPARRGEPRAEHEDGGGTWGRRWQALPARSRASQRPHCTAPSCSTPLASALRQEAPAAVTLCPWPHPTTAHPGDAAGHDSAGAAARGTRACVGVAVPLTEALPRRHAGQPSRTQTRGAQPDTLLPSLPQGRSANSKDSDRFQARQTGAQSRQPGAARSGDRATARRAGVALGVPARARRDLSDTGRRGGGSAPRPPWTVLPGGQLSDSALRKTHSLRCRVRKRQPRRPPLRCPNPRGGCPPAGPARSHGTACDNARRSDSATAAGRA